MKKTTIGLIVGTRGFFPSSLAEQGRKDIINIDIFAFNEVDIVADAEGIPIENNSADLIICVALLEHVKDPQAVVAEMHRIVKSNGEVFCFIPFMQPFHAAPNDFQRWTIPQTALNEKRCYLNNVYYT